MENGERKKCLAGPRSIVLCGVSGASPSAGESTRAGVPGELSDIAARRASGDGQRTKDKGQSTKCHAGLAQSFSQAPFLGFLVIVSTFFLGFLFLLTVKRDTGGANNQVSEKLWG